MPSPVLRVSASTRWLGCCLRPGQAARDHHNNNVWGLDGKRALPRRFTPQNQRFQQEPSHAPSVSPLVFPTVQPLQNTQFARHHTGRRARHGRSSTGSAVGGRTGRGQGDAARQAEALQEANNFGSHRRTTRHPSIWPVAWHCTLGVHSAGKEVRLFRFLLGFVPLPPTNDGWHVQRVHPLIRRISEIQLVPVTHHVVPEVQLTKKQVEQLARQPGERRRGVRAVKYP